MEGVEGQKDGLGNLGRNIAINYYKYDDNPGYGADSSEGGMFHKLIYYPSGHFPITMLCN